MKKRIDRLLVERGFAETREKAQALIMAGNVLVGEEPATKAGMPVAEDADIGAAVKAAVASRFENCGQICICNERMYLHEKIADAFLDQFLALARSIKLGNPLDPGTEMGPLTSQQHRDRVLSYVKVARDEGGEVLLGGKVPERDELAKGCYVEPTVVRAKPGDRVSVETKLDLYLKPEAVNVRVLGPEKQ